MKTLKTGMQLRRYFMSNTNRNWKLIAKRWLIVLLIIVLILGAYTQVYSKMPATDEKAINEHYQEYLAKYDAMKSLSELAIHQGQGISIHQLSEENVKYQIYNTDKNIIVEYEVNPKFGRNTFSFNAKLTLSEDYEILKEKYSEAKELDEFKREYTFQQHLLALLFGILIVVILYFDACLCYGIFHLTKHLFKLFEKEKQTTVDSDTDYPETPTG